jgi:Methylmalonic aciduria and homocystinuria type D protein
VTKWSEVIISKLQDRGFWADFVDPCSGLVIRTPHARVVYPEVSITTDLLPCSCTVTIFMHFNFIFQVDSVSLLLQYKTYDAGGCKVLSHPSWGTSVYPATLFVKAPVSVLIEILKE